MSVQTETPTPPPAATAALVTPVIDPKLIVPFVNSVRAVFSKMVKVESTIQRPRLKIQDSVSHDVSCIIGFSGDVVGSVVVSFELAAAEKLVQSFAGMAIPSNSPDFADALGELTNMIAGGAKANLGTMASITCPNVIIGKGHHVARLRDVPCVVVPCQTPFGEFAVEVNIQQIKTAPRREGAVQ